MGLINRSFARLKFASGYLEVRKITKIERGSIVIDGLRYELSPNEWFLCLYLFFPTHCGERLYTKSFCKAEICYDYFHEDNCVRHKGYGLTHSKSYYSIFNHGKQTGYIIEERRSDKTNIYNMSSAFSIYIIPDRGNAYRYNYNRLEDALYDGTYSIYNNFLREATIWAYGDPQHFEKIEVDLKNLESLAKENLGTHILYEKLIKLLPKCPFLKVSE